MQMTERIQKAINNEYKGIDGLIAVAYWIGKHDAAVEVCDKHHELVQQMRDRANQCRYHKMANTIIGERQGTDIIYHSDYSSDFSDWTVDEILEKKGGNENVSKNN